MSAPPGRARTSNLGRVSTKGPGRGRDNRNGTNTTSLVRQSARSSATSLGTGNQRLLKPSTKQQRGANGPSERSRKHSSSARTTTTKASLSEDEAWRNATIASSSSYKQHMSDLYQKVRRAPGSLSLHAQSPNFALLSSSSFAIRRENKLSEMESSLTRINPPLWPMPSRLWGRAGICARNSKEWRESYSRWLTDVRRCSVLKHMKPILPS